MKIMRLPLFIFFFTAALGILTSIFKTDIYATQYRWDEVYKCFLFYFSDFFLPFFASAAIITQIGGTLETRTFPFFCSLPVKENIFVRWLYTFIICFLTFWVTITVMFFAVKNSYNFDISLGRMYYIGFTDLVWFSSLALLAIIITRQIFYAFCFLYGYMFVDLLVGENLIRHRSAFINISGTFPKELADSNRLGYYISSAVIVLISFVLVKTDFPRKVNRKV